MTCVTEGGNPLPTLLWLRNGLPLNERSMLDQIDASEDAEAGSANAAGATIGGSKCNDEEAKCTFGLSLSLLHPLRKKWIFFWICDSVILL